MLKNRIVVGISGASGVENSVDLCHMIAAFGYHAKIIISKGALLVEKEESEGELSLLNCYDVCGGSISEGPASGSFDSIGMIVYPCSIGTLSKIVNSTNDTLLVRAADVTLKEGRPLILVVRETPLHKGHLKLMLEIVDRGGVIMPFMPAFYIKNKYDMRENLKNFHGRLLSRFGIKNDIFYKWKND